MKNKLKKDLRFLKPIIGRTIIALILAGLKAILSFQEAYNDYNNNKAEETFIVTWFVWFFIFFIAIYIFTTWLYGDEQKENK